MRIIYVSFPIFGGLINIGIIEIILTAAQQILPFNCFVLVYIIYLLVRSAKIRNYDYPLHTQKGMFMESK